jgi:hypothetical protein
VAQEIEMPKPVEEQARAPERTTLESFVERLAGRVDARSYILGTMAVLLMLKANTTFARRTDGDHALELFEVSGELWQIAREGLELLAIISSRPIEREFSGRAAKLMSDLIDAVRAKTGKS